MYIPVLYSVMPLKSVLLRHQYGICACCHGNRYTRGLKMVKLHIRRGDESQFLYETKTDIPLSQLVPHLVRLFNGRLKVDRLCQGWLQVEPLVGGWGALIRTVTRLAYCMMGI